MEPLVGVGTCCWLDGLGFEPYGAKFSLPIQTSLQAHLASCTVGSGCLLERGSTVAEKWHYPLTSFSYKSSLLLGSHALFYGEFHFFTRTCTSCFIPVYVPIFTSP